MIDNAVFLICCLGAEKEETPTRREYARLVLERYLTYPARHLTDAEKTAIFERAKADGVEVVDHLARRKVWEISGE